VSSSSSCGAVLFVFVFGFSVARFTLSVCSTRRAGRAAAGDRPRERAAAGAACLRAVTGRSHGLCAGPGGVRCILAHTVCSLHIANALIM
jgi:hypothetical protein